MRFVSSVAALGVAALSLLPVEAFAVGEFQSKKVAVAVFSSQPEFADLMSAVQARIEETLADNDVQVLDKEKTESLKQSWTRLDDPGFFLTAEDIVAASERYGIDGVLRVYVRADVTPMFGDYYSSTAQIDLRYVTEDAGVTAKTNHPMGAPGSPPSDGLTRNAAVVNALQRAADQSLEAIGLVVSAPVSPRNLKMTLTGPLSSPLTGGIAQHSPPLAESDIALAPLLKKRWESESVSCSAKAAGGALGAVGGHMQVIPRGDKFAHQGANLHIVDLGARRNLATYEVLPISRRTRDRSGATRILDCTFLGSWRYLALLTGDALIVWDVERGVESTRIGLSEGIEEGRLALQGAGADSGITVQGNSSSTYRFQVARGTP